MSRKRLAFARIRSTVSAPTYGSKSSILRIRFGSVTAPPLLSGPEIAEASSRNRRGADGAPRPATYNRMHVPPGFAPETPRFRNAGIWPRALRPDTLDEWTSGARTYWRRARGSTG